MDIPTGATELEELFESVEPGAGTQIQDYLRSSAEMYQLALQQYLYTNFTITPVIIVPKNAVETTAIGDVICAGL